MFMKTARTFLSLLILAAVLFITASCDFGQDDFQNHSSHYNSSRQTEESFQNEISSPIDSTDTSIVETDDTLLTVRYIDVGQGDSSFITFPDGTCMLIDAGVESNALAILSVIVKLGYDRIDYVVITHPHTDHIGGMKRILETFEIGKIYMPNVTSNTDMFYQMLDAIEKKDLIISEAIAGRIIKETDDIKVQIVAPIAVDEENLNNSSAVVHIRYGSKAFLFMGDAEFEEEDRITADIKCDVVKVGHHGSYGSSGNYLVSKADADIAVISCGVDNDYGHPHQAAINRWIKGGVSKFYRTDLQGTITISTDGKSIIQYDIVDDTSDTASDTIPEGYWVLNTKIKKIHRHDCPSVKDIASSNRSLSNLTEDQLEILGYTPCGACKPFD